MERFSPTSCPKGLFASTRIIVSDVDDTITANGRLTPESLGALYEAERKGYRTILLTGGSAGWSEVYIRQWPVFMVVAESGAVLLYKGVDGGILYQQNPVIAGGDPKKRADLLRMIGNEYLSSDQYARIYDIAVDLQKCPEDKVKDIEEAADSLGAHHARSSIHLNIWFGDYSKRKGFLKFMELCGIDEGTLKESCVYFGDARNDEEMFSLIPLSFGMRSVKDNEEAFSVLPKYYTEKGIAEIIGAMPDIN